MSYHEIEVAHKWVLKCLDCECGGEFDSAGEAEQYAKHHINDDIGDEEPRPFSNHIVEIAQHTVVGKNVI